MLRHFPILILISSFVAACVPAEGTRTTEAETESVPRWLAANAIRLSTVEAGNGFADMQELAELVGDARIVLIGDPTHGNREVYQLKHRMIEFLVEQMDFNVLALETPMPESFDVHDYVATGVGDPEKVLAATHVWPWDTEEMLEMIEWMRRYNADPVNPRKLTFYGFDIQSPERAAGVMLGYLDRVDPELAATARTELGHLAVSFSDPDAGGYRPVGVSDFDASVQQALGKVLSAFDMNRNAWGEATGTDDWMLARQHARVLGQWVEANRDGGRAYGAVRDSAMAENIRWIRNREGPDAKMVVWAHNSHIANAEASHRGDGTDWAGRHLRRMFEDEVLILGFLFNQGGFNALDVALPSRGVWPFEVGPAPEGTIEAMFSDAGLRLAIVDLRRLPADATVADWFRLPRPTRNSWGGYKETAPENYFHDYLAPEAFDALVYIHSTTPMRLIEPADYGTFPVLPVPANLDFEGGFVGEPPEDWLVWSKLRRFGFEIATSDDRPYQGERAAAIRRVPADVIGEASGSVLQRVDATPYRGRRIQLRAAARAELDDGIAFLRMRILPGESDDAHSTPEFFFDSLDEHRVTSPDWRVYEIVADVPEHAEIISFGLFLAGTGTAWLDAVSVEVGEE